MKRFFSSKDKRKQAEDQIIRDLIKINDNLEKERNKLKAEKHKTHVMSVLTRFLKIKSDTKIH